MKTIYLIGWIVNAILLSIFWPSKEWFIIQMFNVLIPCSILIIRMLLIHIEIDESKIIV